MEIKLHFEIDSKYVGGTDVYVIIENAPYVPEDGVALGIQWDEFLDEKTADIALQGIFTHRLAPQKTSEIWGKNKIEVFYEFFPIEDEDYPNLN